MKWLYLYRNCIIQEYCCDQVSSINQLKTSLDFNSLYRCTMTTVEINLGTRKTRYLITRIIKQRSSSSKIGIHLRRKNANNIRNNFDYASSIIRQRFVKTYLDGELPNRNPQNLYLTSFLLSLCSLLPSQKNPRRILPNPIFALQSILRKIILRVA